MVPILNSWSTVHTATMTRRPLSEEWRAPSRLPGCSIRATPTSFRWRIAPSPIMTPTQPTSWKLSPPWLISTTAMEHQKKGPPCSFVDWFDFSIRPAVRHLLGAAVLGRCSTYPLGATLTSYGSTTSTLRWCLMLQGPVLVLVRIMASAVYRPRYRDLHRPIKTSPFTLLSKERLWG